MSSFRRIIEAVAPLTIVHTTDLPPQILEFLLALRYFEQDPHLPQGFIRRTRRINQKNIFSTFSSWHDETYLQPLKLADAEHITVPDHWTLSLIAEDDVPGVVFGALVHTHPKVVMKATGLNPVKCTTSVQDESKLWTFRSSGQFIARAYLDGRIMFAVKGIPTTRGWIRSRTY